MGCRNEEEERKPELIKMVFGKILREHAGKDHHLMPQKKGS